jgi:co-chaperonin GroES (HSP10)
MRIRPKKDLVLVKEVHGEQKLNSGLLMPGSGQPIQVRTGEVLDVGPGILEFVRGVSFPLHKVAENEPPTVVNPKETYDGWLRRPPTFEVGQHVLYLQNAALSVTDSRGALFLVREHDILAVAEEEDTEE